MLLNGLGDAFLGDATCGPGIIHFRAQIIHKLAKLQLHQKLSCRFQAVIRQLVQFSMHQRAQLLGINGRGRMRSGSAHGESVTCPAGFRKQAALVLRLKVGALEHGAEE